MKCKCGAEMRDLSVTSVSLWHCDPCDGKYKLAALHQIDAKYDSAVTDDEEEESDDQRDVYVNPAFVRFNEMQHRHHGESDAEMVTRLIKANAARGYCF